MSRQMSPQAWIVTVAAATFLALYTTLSPTESREPAHPSDERPNNPDCATAPPRPPAQGRMGTPDLRLAPAGERAEHDCAPEAGP